MQRRPHIKRKYICHFLVALVVSFSLVQPLSASAQQNKVIRVGIFDYKAFYGVDAQDKQYGYGYEYLDTLAEYGGFRYEYVYGTWAECLAWLESGEIDMLDSAQRVPERETRFLFSAYSTGMSYGELFVRADDNTILYNDFAAMNGLQVGMLMGNSRNSSFLAYAAGNGFSVEPVLFHAEAELSSALQEGTVDAIVSSNLRQGKNERPVTRFSPTPFYMMFHINNGQLKSAVDIALEQILVDDPNFNTKLLEKYYMLGDILPTLTREEQAFVKESAVLRVAYSRDWAPFAFSDNDTSESKGISVDILNLIGASTGLRFDYKQSDSQEHAVNMVASGQADLLLSFESAGQKPSQLGFSATDAFLSVPLCLIGRSQQVSDYAVFAVPQRSEEMIWLLKEQFPNSSIIVLDTIEECYQAVLSRQADFTMDNIYTAIDYIGSGEGRNLAIAFVSPVKGYHFLGLPQDADPTLIRVLNRGIASVSQAEQSSIFARYTVNRATIIPISSLLKEYRGPVVAALIVVLFALVAAAVLLRIRYKNRKQALWQTAYIDPLTGMGNLCLLAQEMGQRLKRYPETKYVVCKFDIENLKILNEIYGFEAGDKIIMG